MKFFLTFCFILIASTVMSQKAVQECKLHANIQRIAIEDGFKVKIVEAHKNSMAVYGNKDAVKSVVAKVKNNNLTIFQVVKAQVFMSDTPAKIIEGSGIDSIVISLASRPENISINNGTELTFEKCYTPKRLILKAENHSIIYGEINCDAFGLTVQSRSDAYLSGKFRTTKILADSASIVFSNYEAVNSELSALGGSIVSIEGNTNILKLIVHGQSRVEALQLQAKKVDADIIEQSDAFFNSSDFLKIRGRDKSHIVVTGNPDVEADVSNDCKYGRR